jgi:HEAT repeat protein
LADPDHQVRNVAILSLGRMGKGSSQLEQVLRNLTRDDDPTTRVNAIISVAALGKFDEGSLQTLITGLESKEYGTAKAAERVLGDWGSRNPETILPSLVEILKKTASSSRTYVIRILRKMKGHAVSTLPLLVDIYDQSDAAVRTEIVEAVSVIDTSGDYAIPIFAKALKEKSPYDRKEALIGLIRYKSRPELILGPISGALRDSEPENRLLAVGIIRGMGEQAQGAWPELLSLTNDPDVRVRSSVVSAIGSLKPLPPEALGILDKAIKNNDSKVRMAAVNALRQVGTDHPKEALSILAHAQEQESNDQTKKLISTVIKAMTEPTAGQQKRSAETRLPPTSH